MELKKENLVFRFATEDDAEKILKIYKPYIENTTITFEYEVPTIEEFRERIRETLEEYPYIVCECGNEILDMLMHIKFGLELLISGMLSFQSIPMGSLLEMELEKNCIKF